MPYDAGLINVDLSTKMGYEITFHGYHDEGLARLLQRAVKPGSVCIDVGANVGAYTLVMAFAAGPAGQVIAVEPNPQVADGLRQNVALNGLTNVRVIEAALSDQDGESTLNTFEQDAPNRMTSSLLRTQFATEGIRVKTVSGDAVVRELQGRTLDVAKIDCIGAEMIVLRQLAAAIERDRPFLFVDYRYRAWQRFGHRPEDAVELLRSWQYDVYVDKGPLTRPLEGEVPDKCNLVGIPASRRIEPPPSAAGA